MNSFSKDFSRAFQDHEGTLEELKNLMANFDVEKLLEENVELKNQSEYMESQLEKLAQANNQLQEEVGQWKLKYRDQVIQRKLNIVEGSKKKLDQLFSNQITGHLNQLDLVEKKISERFSKFNNKIKEQNEDIASEFNSRLLSLFESFKAEIQSHKEQLQEESQLVRKEIDDTMADPSLIKVDENILTKAKALNPMELKLGLNLVNKLGVLLVILAVILAGRYTFNNWFTDSMKGIGFYGIGLFLLFGGEWFKNKDMRVFSLGLIGGGIGVFYAATFINYFYLDLISMSTALIVSVVIAVSTLALTLRYKSSIICSLSLIGGYLPFFTYVYVFGIDQLPVMGALIYVSIFNAMVLGISLKEKWYSVIYISFIMNIPCSNYLISILDSTLIALIYTYGLFIVYSTVIVYRNLIEKEALKVLDLILLVINALVNVSMVYYLFTKAGYENFDGILAIVYALLYFGAAKLLDNKQADNKMIHTFYIFAVGFSVLVVPLQFSADWVLWGWLLESMVFIYYGKQLENKSVRHMGHGLLGITHLIFVVEFMDTLFHTDPYPGEIDLKFLALVIGQGLVFYVYKDIEKHAKKLTITDIYRYFVLASGAIFGMYNVLMINTKWLLYGADGEYTSVALMALFLIGYTYLLNRLHLSKWVVLKKFNLVIISISCFLLLLLNLMEFPYESGIGYVISFILMLLSNCFVLWKINMALKWNQNKGNMTREMRGMLLGLYTLAIYFMNLGIKFRLDNWSITINISLIVFALLYIGLGFKERFTSLRRMGLGLALLSTAKMTIFDILATSTVQKIIGYFVFGFVLIGISFIYQKLSNKLLEEEESQ